MGAIGSNPPTSTRAEAADVMVGNFIQNPGITTDITVGGLRKADLNYDTESISNAVRFLTATTVRGKFANNGDFDINTDALFVKQSNKFTGFGTTDPKSKVSVSGGLAVGAGFVGTASPANGAIIESRLGIGTPSPSAAARLTLRDAAADLELTLLDYSANSAHSPVVTLSKSHSDTPGTELETVDTEILGRVDAWGRESDNGFEKAASIQFIQEGASTSNRVTAAIAFFTETSSNTITEQFRIKSNGVPNFSNMPTSAAGLSAGDVWSNGGVLTLV